MSLTAGQLALVRTHQRFVSPARKQVVFEKHKKVWIELLLRMFSVRIMTEPGRQIPEKRATGRLIVSNHRSPYDIAVLLSVLGGRFLSRGDLADWPVLGQAAKAAGTIFVDRSRGTSGAAAIRAIRKGLAAGDTITVFPEGTTFAGDEVRAFRGGAFVGLHRLDVEILPVGLAYEAGVEFVDETFPQHLVRVARRPVTRVGLAVGEPFAPGQKAHQTAELARSEVERLVQRARRLVGSSDRS